MSAGRVLPQQSTPPQDPPSAASNEAEPEQLDIARQQGDTYRDALHAMAEEDGAAIARAGQYLIALINEQAEGMYQLSEAGELKWREAPEEANAHIEVAVADAADGRFLPGLEVRVTVLDADKELFTAQAPFLWHPFLFHYGFNAKVPGEGPYVVKVQIDPPSWMRHDPVNGRRYADPVEVIFVDVGFAPGRKTSPDAAPRGPATTYAGA